MKVCSKCGVEKPKSEFYPRPSRPCGVTPSCKKCQGIKLKAYNARPERQAIKRETKKIWEAANPDKVQKWEADRKMRKYEFTHARFDELWKRQGGECAICKDQLKARGRGGVAIDHTHGTSPVVVRGLLCAPCNTALGGFRDSPELLRSAINYLQPVRFDEHAASTG